MQAPSQFHIQVRVHPPMSLTVTSPVLFTEYMLIVMSTLPHAASSNADVLTYDLPFQTTSCVLTRVGRADDGEGHRDEDRDVWKASGLTTVK